MSTTENPVYIDPYDEGAQLAREGKIDARILALPSCLMAEQLAYSQKDWRRFRKGALSVLMDNKRASYETADHATGGGA